MNRDQRGESMPIFDGYARLYGPLAVGSACLTFMPILDDQMVDPVDGSLSRSSGTLWDMAARPYGEVAVLAILLAVTFTAFLVAATFKPRSAGLAAGVAVTGLLVIVMLATRPDTGDPTPALSPAGIGGMVMAIGACVLGVVNAVHVRVWSGRAVAVVDREDSREA